LPTAQTVEERSAAASSCSLGLNLNLTVLLDSMDNSANRLYGAWPERLAVLIPGGKLAYLGGKGPYHFDLDELEATLKELLNS
jgi:Iodothyronine deiodinase